MRIILLVLPAIFVSHLQASAQVEKGQLYGELFLGRKLWNHNTNSIRPSLTIGLDEHSTLGVFYTYTRYKSMPVAGLNSYVSNVAGAGVSYSYLKFFKKSTKWGWYGNASFSFTTISLYEKSGGSTLLNNRYSERTLSLTPGIFFKPSSRFLLFGNLGGIEAANNRYDFFKPRSSFAEEINLGIQIRLGNLKNKKERPARTNF